MRRRLIGLALGLVVAGAVVPSAVASGSSESAEAEGQSRLFVIERTTSGPSRLVMSAGFGYGTFWAPDGFIAVAAVRDDVAAPRGIAEARFGFIVSNGGDVLPYLYANGERVDCSSLADPPPEQCDLFISGGGTGLGWLYEDDGGPDSPTRIFVAVHGQGPGASLSEQTDGWTIREVQPSFSFVRGSEALAVGAQSLGAGGEVFLSADASGGEHGSIAVGQPPCGFPMFDPGAGVTMLTGGVGEPLHVCGADWDGIADVAPEATAWSFQGAAAGASALHFGQARLVVIDRPPPCEPDQPECEDF